MRSDQAAFLLLCVLMVVFTIAWFFAYQIFCLRRWQSTLGQRVLGLKVTSIWGAELTTEAIVLRSWGLLLTVIGLGVPALGVLSNSRRRAFHDRLSDTMVVSLQAAHSALEPTKSERVFVRGVYAGLMGLVLLAGTVVCLELPNLVRHLDVLEDSLCSDVTAAHEEDHQSRIALAHELFAASLIDADCLKQEAYNTIYNVKFQKDLGYLALAMVYESEPEVAERYAQMVCATNATTEPCVLIEMLRSDDTHGHVSERLSTLSKSSFPYARVWAIRSYMRLQQYEAALRVLNSTSDDKNLTPFSLRIRTQAYLTLKQVDKAELTAQIGLEVLPADQAADLASFMCFEQLETTCQPAKSNLCDWLFAHSREVTSSTTGILARFRVRECQGDHDALDELALSPRRDLERLRSALLMMKNRDKNAFLKLETLLYDSESAPLRREIARQWIRSARRGEDVESLAEYVNTLPQSHERSVLTQAMRTAFPLEVGGRQPANATSEEE